MEILKERMGFVVWCAGCRSRPQWHSVDVEIQRMGWEDLMCNVMDSLAAEALEEEERPQEEHLTSVPRRLAGQPRSN